MKKLIAIIAILAFATTVFATESDPSETVGFVKIASSVGYTPFSLPFTFYDATHTETMDIDDVIGNQLTGGTIFTGDRIIEIGGTAYSYLLAAGTWSGTLVDFVDNKGYYFKIQSGHSAKDVYIAGTVEQSAQLIANCGVGYTSVSVNEAGEIPVANLDLITSGFTGGTIFDSDRLIELGGTAYAYYNTTTLNWGGSLLNIEPGKVYYVKVQSGHTPFNWNYDPFSKGTTEGKVKINKITKPINFK